MRPWLLLPLLLAACDRGPDSNAAGAEQIAQVSKTKRSGADPSESARLEPLRPGDPIADGAQGGSCDFSQEGAIYLVSSPRDTVARIEGRLIHLVPSGPIGDTGGFFEERQISISVGRLSQGEGEGAGPSLARVAVTNRRTGAESRLHGLWTCVPGADDDQRR